MKQLTQNLELHFPNCLYLKNPKGSEIGESIVEMGAHFLGNFGLEELTFKKLAIEVGCTEATIYRYFNNKQQLLLYILNIYWSWQEYVIVFNCQNIENAEIKLKRVISALAKPEFEFLANRTFANNVLLTAINEGVKAHYTIHIQNEMDHGKTIGYQRLISRIAEYIEEYNKLYPYSNSMAICLADSALQQLFIQSHHKNKTKTAIGVENIEKFLFSILPNKLK